MTTTRELNADELSIASGGGINMGSLAAIAAAPRLLSMFSVAWGLGAASQQNNAAPCVSNDDDDSGYCSFL